MKLPLNRIDLASTVTKQRHHRAMMGVMVLVTLLWSVAGVISRHFETVGRVETTFWRSLVAGISIVLFLSYQQRKEGDGGQGFIALVLSPFRQVLAAGSVGWVSGVCWSVMYTFFMLSLMFTSVANTLVISSLSPLFTAVWSALWLKKPVSKPMWFVILTAFAGIVLMCLEGLLGKETAAYTQSQHLLGITFAFAVPLAAAINLVNIQKHRQTVNLLPTLVVGGLLSALATLPFAWPFQASSWDMFLLLILGVFQLALPCFLLVVFVSRALSATEIALVGLFEAIFGILWAWVFAGETLSWLSLSGAAVVLVSIALKEVLSVLKQA